MFRRPSSHPFLRRRGAPLLSLVHGAFLDKALDTYSCTPRKSSAFNASCKRGSPLTKKRMTKERKGKERKKQSQFSSAPFPVPPLVLPSLLLADDSSFESPNTALILIFTVIHDPRDPLVFYQNFLKKKYPAAADTAMETTVHIHSNAFPPLLSPPLPRPV